MEECKTYRMGDLFTLEYGKPIDDKDSLDGPAPVFGTNGQIGTSHLTPLCGHPSVILGRKGAYRGVHFSEKPFSVIDTAFYIEPISDVFDIKWLYYKLLTYDINSMDSGSAIPSTDRYQIYSLPIEVPPIGIQKQIVRVLDSLNDKIALNNRINHNLEDFLLSLYGRLLDSQCGSSTIGQVSERVYSGGTPDTKNSDYWGGTINWLSSGETSNHFIIDTEKRITENGVLHSSTKFASKYDVVIASAGQGNTRGQTSMTLLDTCINQSVIVIHANTYEAPIVFCSLANRYDELRAISDASSIRGSLTTKMISALEIPVFPEADTFKFASQAKYIIDQIENNLRENHSLKAMRDSLLPRLMSGEFCK